MTNVNRQSRETRPRREKWLAALPVFNEVDFVDEILNEVLRYSERVLVVDDGSTDGTAEKLAARNDVAVVTHAKNRGYGAALKSAFAYTIEHGFDGVVTLDCDGQHQPKRIPRFIESAAAADIVSGSRYLKAYEGDDAPPPERMFINRTITRELNDRLGFDLTDTFCGFKAYRAEALLQMDIEDDGYAMPLELWVQAAAADLRIVEIPVPLIYLDLERSFGGSLDHSETRLRYYREVVDTAVEKVCAEGGRIGKERSLCNKSTG